MVNIKSVRHPVVAPQEPILGGALKGFAQNLTLRQEQEAETQANEQKYMANMLNSLAQQGILAKGGNLPDWYKGMDLENASGKTQTPGQRLSGLRADELDIELGNTDPKKQYLINQRKKEMMQVAHSWLKDNIGDTEGAMEQAKAYGESFDKTYGLAGTPFEMPKPPNPGFNSMLKGMTAGMKAGQPSAAQEMFSNKPQEPQTGAIKSLTTPDGMKTEFHAPVEPQQPQAQPEKTKPKKKSQVYKPGQVAVKDGVKYTRQADGIWKPSK